MPIRPEHRHHYGAAWKVVRAKILAREKNRCLYCARPNRQDIAILPCGCWWTASAHEGDVVERGKPPPDLHTAADHGYGGGLCRGSVRIVRTVLTIAHLNHVAGDDREENLAALCQRCHLRLDRAQHAETARATRNRKRGVQELPL